MPGPAALDPILHQPVRAQVMAYLYKNKQAPMTTIRDELGLTGGNLGSHAIKLQEAGYIEVRKVLAGIFEVRYFLTPKGSKAFEDYVRALRELIRGVD